MAQGIVWLFSFPTSTFCTQHKKNHPQRNCSRGYRETEQTNATKEMKEQRMNNLGGVQMTNARIQNRDAAKF